MELSLADLAPVRHPQIRGDLRRWHQVELPGLGRRADLDVWLPPGALDSGERYPTVYLHDGGNAFVPERSFAGATWQVDATMTALAADGLQAVVVAVPCSPDRRGEEYSPYPHPEFGGGDGDTYVDLLAHELVPAVDAVLPTRPDPEDRIVLGSSLGAVVTAHLWHRHPDLAHGLGLFSPAFWWPGEPALRDLEEGLASGRLRGRVHLDVGGHEEPGDPEIEEAYLADAVRVLRALHASEVAVHAVFDSSAYHHEDAWARRLPAALTWLLRDHAAPRPPFVAP